MFFLDLKSAYHQVDLHRIQGQNIGNILHLNGFTRMDQIIFFLLFEVFVFGLSSAPYIFYESARDETIC